MAQIMPDTGVELDERTRISTTSCTIIKGDGINIALDPLRDGERWVGALLLLELPLTRDPAGPWSHVIARDLTRPAARKHVFAIVVGINAVGNEPVALRAGKL